MSIIFHDKIFYLFQIGLKLAYSQEMSKDKWGFIKINVKFAYLQTTSMCSNYEDTHIPLINYNISCPTTLSFHKCIPMN